MKKTTLASIAVFIIILGTVIYWMNGTGQESKEKVQEIKIGQVYEDFYNNYRIFTDETHFISYSDDSAQYKSQKEIDTEASDNEQAIFPFIDVSEGTYEKRGDSYVLTYKRTTTIYFQDYESLKNKEYFDREVMEHDEVIKSMISKRKDGYALAARKDYYLYKSDVKLPTSIDEILSAYTYVPGEW